MSRTDIDLDDELVGEVIRRYGLESKREAVDFALCTAVPTVTPEDIDALRGIGWEVDLERMRQGDDPEYKWRSTAANSSEAVIDRFRVADAAPAAARAQHPATTHRPAGSADAGR